MLLLILIKGQKVFPGSDLNTSNVTVNLAQTTARLNIIKFKYI